MVRFWQTIYVEEDTSEFSTCWFVDGIYGPNTADKVAWVQKRLGVTSDGWVGSQSWRAAESRLRHITNDDLTFDHFYLQPGPV